MGQASTKFSFHENEFQLKLFSNNSIYRGLELIQGELSLNPRRKIRIEKEIRIDFVGELIEKKRKTRFFTYSFALITSHQNGTARTIKKQQEIHYPFRIPLGVNLPPTCQFKTFEINYHLEIYHDGCRIPQIHKRIILMPRARQITTAVKSSQVKGPASVTAIGSLEKSFYSSRDRCLVPLKFSICNPQSIEIRCLTMKLVQNVTFNGHKQENEILKHEIEENSNQSIIDRVFEWILPLNLPPTTMPNSQNEIDHLPSLIIKYEFHLNIDFKEKIHENLNLIVPIGID